MARASSHAHLLDNPVWHALRGPLSRFASADSAPDFLRFDPEVGLFSAVEHFEDDRWARIAEHVGVGGFCALVRPEVSAAPAGWQEHYRGGLWQMTAGDLPAPARQDIVRLGASDHAEMLALVQLTEAAPFFSRTPELGRYVGVRRDGKLVAMAGERLRVEGYVEVSAVCTHPDVRGQGLGTDLTLNAAQAIRAQGEEPFLHVLDTNEAALRLYETLGFVRRREMEIVFAQWLGPDAAPGG